MTVCKALGGGVAASAAECAGTATGGGSRRSAIMSALGKPAVERIAVGCMGGTSHRQRRCWQRLLATRQTGAGGHACASPRETVACQCSRVRRDHAIQRMARLATLPTSSAAPGRRAEFLCAATKSHRPARRRINPARRRCWRAARTLCRHRRARALGLAQAGAERYAGDCDGTAPARCVAGNAAATSAGSGCCQSRSGMWQQTQSHWGWPSARRCRCWLWRGWGLPTTAPMFLDAPSAPAGSTTRALRQRSPCADSRVNGRVRPSPGAYATDRTNSPAPSDRRQRAPWPLRAPTSAPSACAGWCGPFRRFIRAMPWLDICAGTAATTRNVQIKKLDRLR